MLVNLQLYSDSVTTPTMLLDQYNGVKESNRTEVGIGNNRIGRCRSFDQGRIISNDHHRHHHNDSGYHKEIKAKRRESMPVACTSTDASFKEKNLNKGLKEN